jgi:type IX secretion system substrate protein
MIEKINYYIIQVKQKSLATLALFVFIAFFTVNADGQHVVSNLKLPSTAYGGSNVFEIISTDSRVFALSHNKILVFTHDGTFERKLDFGNYGKFNNLGHGTEDVHYMAYNPTANVLYVLTPELRIFMVNTDTWETSTFDPIINQLGQTLHEKFIIMSERVVMKFDEQRNRLYLLVEGRDPLGYSSCTGNFHESNYFFGIYNADENTGDWALFYEEFVDTNDGEGYFRQIGNFAFNRGDDTNPNFDLFYLTRLGEWDENLPTPKATGNGIIDVYKIENNSTVSKIHTIVIPNYPLHKPYYKFGKMFSYCDGTINKIFIFPKRYSTYNNTAGFWAKICIIEGNYNPINGIEYQEITAPNQLINDAAYLPSHKDLIMCYAPIDDNMQSQDYDNSDVAVYTYNPLTGKFDPATTKAYLSGTAAINMGAFDINAPVKITGVNNEVVLLSKKDEMVKMALNNSSDNYSFSQITAGESNFYGKGTSGLQKSFVINSCANGIEVINNSNYSIQDPILTSYPVYNITSNSDGTKMYYYNTLNAHNTGLYIKSNGAAVNINHDGDGGNDISSAIGGCIYNPFLNQFLVSEHTISPTGSVKVIILDGDDNSYEGAIPLTDAEFAGEMFIAPDGTLYVMANMRNSATEHPTVFTFNASSGNYEDIDEYVITDMPNYSKGCVFYSASFCYNKNNAKMYATIYPNELVPDPYHAVKNSMYKVSAGDEQELNAKFVRFNDPTNMNISYSGKMIVPDNFSSCNASQYNNKLFIIGNTFYVYNCLTGGLIHTWHNTPFRDIAYNPVQDQLIGLKDVQDQCKEDRKIEVYYINMDASDGLSFTHQTNLDFDGQAANIFYNPNDNKVYIYNKVDDEKLGGIESKLLYFDPELDKLEMDSIPLGFMPYYREVDHYPENKIYLYNITEPNYQNETFMYLPNGWHSTVSAIKLEDFFDLQPGINWLSFPRLNRHPETHDEEVNPVLKNNITPNPAIGSRLNYETSNNPYYNEFDGTDWLPEGLLSHVKTENGYKLNLEYEGVPEEVLFRLDGVHLAPDGAQITLDDEYETWAGYWLFETQHPLDAIPESVIEQLYMVKGQHWSCTNQIPPPDNSTPPGQTYPWSCYASQGVVEMKYGTMVEIYSDADLSFNWEQNGDPISEENRDPASINSFEEQAAYTPIYVELDSTENPIEIAAFVGDTCVGATTVLNEDSIVLVQAYMEGLSGELTFQEFTGNKSTAINRQEYLVMNQKLGKWEKRTLKTTERKGQYFVSLKGKNTQNTQEDANNFALSCIPNPATETCTVQFTLNEKCWLRLAIYNMNGERVKLLQEGMLNAGQQNLQWDCSNKDGKKVSPGLYFIKIGSETSTAQSKIVIIN